MLKFLANSYDKSCHTWLTGNCNRINEGDPPSLGEPQLMGSFHCFGEVNEAMKADRNQARHR